MLVSFHKLSEESQCDVGKRALWSSGGTENTGWVSTGLKIAMDKRGDLWLDPWPQSSLEKLCLSSFFLNFHL